MRVKKVSLYIILGTLLFSSMEIVLKLAGSTFHPLQLNLIRFTIGAFVLLPFAWHRLRQQKRHIVWKDGLLFAVTGFICVIVSMTFFQLAIEQTKASTVAVLFSCNPLFAILFALVFLKEKITRITTISLSLSIVGLLFIVNPFELHDGLGITFALLAAATFGLYSILSRWGSKRRGFNGLTMTCFTFFAGAFELLLLIGLTHIPFIKSALSSHKQLAEFSAIPIFQGISSETLLLLLYIGIFVTGGGFAFYFLAMEASSVSMAALVFFIKPGLAPLLALLILNEVITKNTIVGICIILAGSCLTFIGETKQKSRRV
nr:DMT family transporter [Brochothrix thermosphacta]